MLTQDNLLPWQRLFEKAHSKSRAHELDLVSASWKLNLYSRHVAELRAHRRTTRRHRLLHIPGPNRTASNFQRSQHLFHKMVNTPYKKRERKHRCPVEGCAYRAVYPKDITAHEQNTAVTKEREGGAYSMYSCDDCGKKWCTKHSFSAHKCVLPNDNEGEAAIEVGVQDESPSQRLATNNKPSGIPAQMRYQSDTQTKYHREQAEEQEEAHALTQDLFGGGNDQWFPAGGFGAISAGGQWRDFDQIWVDPCVPQADDLEAPQPPAPAPAPQPQQRLGMKNLGRKTKSQAGPPQPDLQVVQRAGDAELFAAESFQTNWEERERLRRSEGTPQSHMYASQFRHLFPPQLGGEEPQRNNATDTLLPLPSEPSTKATSGKGKGKMNGPDAAPATQQPDKRAPRQPAPFVPFAERLCPCPNIPCAYAANTISHLQGHLESAAKDINRRDGITHVTCNACGKSFCTKVLLGKHGCEAKPAKKRKPAKTRKIEKEGLEQEAPADVRDALATANSFPALDLSAEPDYTYPSPPSPSVSPLQTPSKPPRMPPSREAESTRPVYPNVDALGIASSRPIASTLHPDILDQLSVFQPNTIPCNDGQDSPITDPEPGNLPPEPTFLEQHGLFRPNTDPFDNIQNPPPDGADYFPPWVDAPGVWHYDILERDWSLMSSELPAQIEFSADVGGRYVTPEDVRRLRHRTGRGAKINIVWMIGHPPAPRSSDEELQRGMKRLSAVKEAQRFLGRGLLSLGYSLADAVRLSEGEEYMTWLSRKVESGELDDGPVLR